MSATPLRDLIVSGVTMLFDPLVFGDLNQTVPEVFPNNDFQPCGWLATEFIINPGDGSTFGSLRWTTWFTRDLTILGGLPGPPLPPGIKLIVEISSDPANTGGGIGPDPFVGRGISVAWFYEVLPEDVDGFADCSLDFTNLILLDQIDRDFQDNLVDDPEAFDASSATITYAV